MNILKAVPAYYPALAFGGPVLKTKIFAEKLTQRGHTVSVVAPNLLDTKRKISNRMVTREVNGVQVTYLNVWFQVGHSGWITFSPDILAFCRKQLQRFDVIQIYGFYDFLIPVVGYYARKWDIPYVIEPLGMYVPILRSFGKKRLYHALFGNWLMANAAHIIATSEQERTELIEAGPNPDKIILRRNGIDLAPYAHLPERGHFRRRFGIGPDEQMILYLSRLSPKKSPDLLLRAFAELGLPKTRLVIAGPGESDGYPEQLQQMTTQLELNGRVLFPGALYGQDKLAAFVDADVLVLPSQNENFGNVVAEAIAAGTPVIVTDRCGIAPYVRDRVGLVINYDLDALRQAIARMLTDQTLRDRFRASCVAVAHEFSWDEPVAQMETLYHDLIAEKWKRENQRSC